MPKLDELSPDFRKIANRQTSSDLRKDLEEIKSQASKESSVFETPDRTTKPH